MEPVTEADPAGSDRETRSVEKKPDCEGHGASAAAKHTPHGNLRGIHPPSGLLAIIVHVPEHRGALMIAIRLSTYVNHVMSGSEPELELDE